jgi:hypothetical protein
VSNLRDFNLSVNFFPHITSMVDFSTFEIADSPVIEEFYYQVRSFNPFPIFSSLNCERLKKNFFKKTVILRLKEDNFVIFEKYLSFIKFFAQQFSSSFSIMTNYFIFDEYIVWKKYNPNILYTKRIYVKLFILLFIIILIDIIFLLFMLVYVII